MHTVSVVIPCLNEVSYIGNCIRSLMEQNDFETALEILVVDGQSTDGTRELVERLSKNDGRVRLIDNVARVTPVALNLGIAAAKGDVIVIMGGHAEAEPDFIRHNLQALQAYPDAGCVGGIIHNVYENRTAAIIGKAMSSPFGVGNAIFRTGGNAGYVDTVAFGAYRREIFDKIGYFDERLVRNQDDEFNYRLLRSGQKIWFDPSIESRYYVRSSYKKLFRQYYQYGYWKVFVNTLHRTVTTWRQLVPFAFVAFLVLMGLAVLFRLEAVIFLVLGLLVWSFTAVFFAVRTTKSLAARTNIMLVFTWFILHSSYGLGYGAGIWSFLILRQKPDTLNPNTTR